MYKIYLSDHLLLTSSCAPCPAQAPQPRAVQATPCGRGLPTPCAVSCTVNWRLCRACCAAVATFQETTTSDSPDADDTTTTTTTTTTEDGGDDASGPPPSGTDLGAARDKAIGEAARCLAVCSKFSAKEIRAILEDPSSENRETLAEQLKLINPDIMWGNVLQSASSRPFTLPQLCNNQLAC